MVLEAGDGQIAWVEGLGIGERFKVEGQTRMVLALKPGGRIA